MRLRLIAATLTLAAATSPLHAQTPCTPVASFGSLAAATFGGTGIPNNAVMQSTCGGVTLGLTATPHYSSPALSNDGLGNFYATPGFDGPNRAKWNFDFFVGGAGANDYFKLLMNGVELTPYYGSSFDRQDSGNIGFAFIGGDPTLDNTDYVFALTQFSDAARTQAVQGVSIDVHVTSTPEPASMILVATGLLGMGVVSRRRKHA